MSFNVCRAFAAAAAIATPSVISSVSRRGSTLVASNACATISSREWSSMMRGETFSATDTSMPVAMHRIQSDPDRGARLDHLIADREWALQRREDLARGGDDIVRMLGVGGEDRELVSAQPGDGVSGPKHPAQAGRHLLQEAVPAVVAERIVDVFEAIEVEKQHAEHALVAARRQQRLPQAVAEQAAVR